MTLHMENVPDRDFLTSQELEKLTGTRASTWRFWASQGRGPTSFRLGRRRVWERAAVLAWLERQKAATVAGEAEDGQAATPPASAKPPAKAPAKRARAQAPAKRTTYRRAARK